MLHLILVEAEFYFKFFENTSDIVPCLKSSILMLRIIRNIPLKNLFWATVSSGYCCPFARDYLWSCCWIQHTNGNNEYNSVLFAASTCIDILNDFLCMPFSLCFCENKNLLLYADYLNDCPAPGLSSASARIVTEGGGWMDSWQTCWSGLDRWTLDWLGWLLLINGLFRLCEKM